MKLLITEKTNKLIKQNQYIFEVDTTLTKKHIKLLLEQFYNIKIERINTLNMVSKKKAIVKFTKPIPIFE
uniref:Large ribosomal subunit protein uL23c n=1 Tax=Caulerpa verticillata TaxID=177082 RepID=A0A386B0D6_9CHLO|nr:ribosomal protein L23 [Caulerpa verticillata]AYC65166.1 ribosomal protein L23 [Caulerpa verticillata]